ncbi:MAG: hypothetical protein SOZ08_03545 [Erysipelotrichaceae bacterium]|nr:hypothetical protein [Erysipelotrichaceae bacterium]
MKKGVQIAVSITMSLFLVFAITPSSVSAQSGEGVDGCNYYWNYGFSDAKSCRAWLDYKEHSSRPYWSNKLAGCIVYTAGFTAAQAKVMLITDIKQAIVVLGGTFIGCMF